MKTPLRLLTTFLILYGLTPLSSFANQPLPTVNFEKMFNKGAVVKDPDTLARQWSSIDELITILKDNNGAIRKHPDFSIAEAISSLYGDVYFIVEPTYFHEMSLVAVVSNKRYISLILTGIPGDRNKQVLTRLNNWTQQSQCALELFDLSYWLHQYQQPFKGLEQNSSDPQRLELIVTCGERV